jgi:Arm DNA-binding domain
MLTTDTAIRNAKPAHKAFRISDGHGLYLLVQPNGSKWWRFDYRRPTSGRNTLSFGIYPDVPLKLARERRDEARSQLAKGIDPGLQRQAAEVAATSTFEAVAREWFARQEPAWAKSHSSKIIARLEMDLFPWIGPRPIDSLCAADVLTCLRCLLAFPTADVGRYLNGHKLSCSILHCGFPDLMLVLRSW